MAQATPWPYGNYGIKLCQYSTDATYYWPGDYPSFAIKVGNGILAFVSNNDNYNINGFGLMAWDNPECSGNPYGWFLRYKDVILADQNIYANTSAVENALSNVTSEQINNACKAAENKLKAKNVVLTNPFTPLPSNGSKVSATEPNIKVRRSVRDGRK